MADEVKDTDLAENIKKKEQLFKDSTDANLCIGRNALKNKNKRRQLNGSIFGRANTDIVPRHTQETETPPSLKKASNSGPDIRRLKTTHNFPKFNDLPQGIDPIMKSDSGRKIDLKRFTVALEQEHTLILNQCKQSNSLLIDDIGYERSLKPIYSIMEKLKPEELMENLQSCYEIIHITMNQRYKLNIRIDLKAKEIHLLNNEESNETIIPIPQITELRFGIKTVVLERNKSLSQNFLPIAICYGPKKPYHILVPLGDRYYQWVACFMKLIITYKEEKDSETLFTIPLWNSLPKNETNPSRTKHKKIEDILKSLDIQINVKQTKKELLFKKYDAGMSFEDLKYLLQSLRYRSELEHIYQHYSSNSKNLSMEELLQFFKNGQKQTTLTKNNIVLLLGNYLDFNNYCAMSKDSFLDYLVSPLNSVFNPNMLDVYQDMTRPLTDYYIYSSHNTYLEGNQISGYSSCDMYARVLKAGCRCVELDCWNGDNGEPIIFHGHTLTSRILFEDVVKIIASYAFVASPYPVILSLENHCNVEQQAKMAYYMIKYFGKSIAQPLWKKEKNKTACKYLPSPEELKKKIIIKGL